MIFVYYLVLMYLQSLYCVDVKIDGSIDFRSHMDDLAEIQDLIRYTQSLDGHHHKKRMHRQKSKSTTNEPKTTKKAKKSKTKKLKEPKNDTKVDVRKIPDIPTNKPINLPTPKNAERFFTHFPNGTYYYYYGNGSSSNNMSNPWLNPNNPYNPSNNPYYNVTIPTYMNFFPTTWAEPAARNNIYVNPYRINHDENINLLINRIKNDVADIFDRLRGNSDVRLRSKINDYEHNYNKKFKEFLNTTRKERIKSTNGYEKAVVNIIETKNRLLERVANHFVVETKHILRSNDAESSFFKVAVEKAKEDDHNHLCADFKICRSKYGYTDFLIDILNVYVSREDRIKPLFDGTTEVFKNADMSIMMDEITEKRFKRAVVKSEQWNSRTIKSVVLMTKNLLVFRKQPIMVMEREANIDQSVALLDLVETLEKEIQANEQNLAVWKKIKSDLQLYVDKNLKDPLPIVEDFLNNLIKNIEQMPSSAVRRISDDFHVIFIGNE